MNDFIKEDEEFLSFKIIQSGEIKKVPLTPMNLIKKFREIYIALLKELRLKQKDTFLSNDEGMMVGIHDLGLTLNEIIIKFGTLLKVYSEKII